MYHEKNVQTQNFSTGGIVKARRRTNQNDGHIRVMLEFEILPHVKYDKLVFILLIWFEFLFNWSSECISLLVWLCHPNSVQNESNCIFCTNPYKSFRFNNGHISVLSYTFTLCCFSYFRQVFCTSGCYYSFRHMFCILGLCSIFHADVLYFRQMFCILGLWLRFSLPKN